MCFQRCAIWKVSIAVGNWWRDQTTTGHVVNESQIGKFCGSSLTEVAIQPLLTTLLVVNDGGSDGVFVAVINDVDNTIVAEMASSLAGVAVTDSKTGQGQAGVQWSGSRVGADKDGKGCEGKGIPTAQHSPVAIIRAREGQW